MIAENMKLLRALEGIGLLYLVAALLLSMKFGSSKITLGVAVGGVIAFLNFRVMQWVCSRLISKQTGTSNGNMTGLVLLKNSLPFLAIGLAIFFFEINPLGLLVGLSAVVAAILLYASWLAIQQVLANNRE